MQPTQRLVSLDVFRGVTIAGMILVNNAGDWSHIYPPLSHAEWHGCTPTDWVFPFFLFIVGVAIAFAVGRRKSRGDSPIELTQKVIIRSIVIFAIGLFLNAFPKFGLKPSTSTAVSILHYICVGLFIVLLFARETVEQSSIKKWLGIGVLGIGALMVVIGFGHYDLSHLRIPGVLQRIALVYLFCGLLFIYAENWRTILYTGIGLLLAYWGIMTLIPVPDGNPPNLDPETNIGAWLDRLLLSTNHLYSQSKTWDPEGFISTIPAFGTGISGILTGLWLKSDRGDYQKVVGILGVGVILVALGLIWDLAFPINKKIWTSSYVLYTSGIALLFLGVIYWLTDILGYKSWTKPFVVYGMNALFVFVMSGLVAKLLYYIKWADGNGNTITLGNSIYRTLFTPFLGPYDASLAYAIMNVLFFLGLAWILYAKKIFIKV